jgi:hypothetical protein
MGENHSRPKCKRKVKNKFEKIVNITIFTRSNCEVFPLNTLTLTCPYCMLTKDINDRVFRKIVQFIFPLLHDA